MIQKTTWKPGCNDGVFAWFTFRDGAVPWIYVMGVSENRGTPKSSILKGFSVINHPFWGYPYFWKHPYISEVVCTQVSTTSHHNIEVLSDYKSIGERRHQNHTTHRTNCNMWTSHKSHSQSPKSQTKCIQFNHHYRSHEISIPSSSPGPIHPACSYSLRAPRDLLQQL